MESYKIHPKAAEPHTTNITIQQLNFSELIVDVFGYIIVIDQAFILSLKVHVFYAYVYELELNFNIIKVII